MGLKRFLERSTSESINDRKTGGESGSDLCSWLVKDASGRCESYVQGGACSRPDVFMCALWVAANADGAARGYCLTSEPDPFATDDDDRAWQPTEEGIDPFAVDGEQTDGEPLEGEQRQSNGEQATEPDPFELGGDEGLVSRGRSMSDPEDEQAPTEIAQLTLARVPDVPPPAPVRRSRVAQAVRGGRGKGGGRKAPRPLPEPEPRTLVEPIHVQGPPLAPQTPAAFAGTVEPDAVERLKSMGLEVDVDGWGDKPIRFVPDDARGETDEGFEMTLADGAAIANILHAFPGARITKITAGKGEPSKK